MDDFAQQAMRAQQEQALRAQREQAMRTQQEQTMRAQQEQTQRSEQMRRQQEQQLRSQEQQRVQAQNARGNAQFHDQMDRAARDRRDARALKRSAEYDPQGGAPVAMGSERESGPKLGLVPAMVLAVLVLAVAAGGYLFFFTGGLNGVVQTDANVRSGPSIEQPVVAGLQAGDDVEVDCVMRGEWLRLAEPFEGRYVHSSLVQVDGTPTAC